MATTVKNPGYTGTAKTLHWLILFLLIGQFTVAWTMPHIGRNTVPETLINLHFSIGVIILAVAIVRLIWRATHGEPTPLDGVPPWQTATARIVHWLLYLLVFATTVSGWLFASARGWKVSWFFLAPLPMLTAGSQPLVRKLDGWHQDFEWALLILIGFHVASAFLHLIYYRDRVMRRMLPQL